jgi:hypothetical protein
MVLIKLFAINKTDRSVSTRFRSFWVMAAPACPLLAMARRRCRLLATILVSAIEKNPDKASKNTMSAACAHKGQESKNASINTLKKGTGDQYSKYRFF